MDHRVLRLLTLLVLTALPAANVFSAGPAILNNYYTDATFTTGCGWTDRDCEDTFRQDGTLTNYRYNQIENCGTGNQTSAHCQEYDAGTGTWVNVTCPDEGATIQGRLRITIG